MGKTIFTDGDFDKSLSIGDKLVFDKPSLKKIRVDLTWRNTDLDVCAFLLGKDGMIHKKEDLVYFNSKLRWKTSKDFNDPNFNPLEGKFSQWPEASSEFKNPNKWMAATLPISSDGAVIGSWDDMADDDTAECGETMHVLLDEVDIKEHVSIVFAAVVAKDRIQKGESFANALDSVVTLYNVDTDEEIVEYKLASSFSGKDAVCLARLDYNQETCMWEFVPMAEGYNGGLQYLACEIFN